eukprot:4492881-Pyramimonas_sp.AAC.1
MFRIPWRTSLLSHGMAICLQSMSPSGNIELHFVLPQRGRPQEVPHHELQPWGLRAVEAYMTCEICNGSVVKIWWVQTVRPAIAQTAAAGASRAAWAQGGTAPSCGVLPMTLAAAAARHARSPALP